MFTVRSSTRIQVNIYAFTFVPCTRLIILGNALLIGSNTSFTDPLFRHLSSSIAFSISPQLTNVRLTRSLLAISSLLSPPHYGFSERSPDLAGKVHHSGARGIPYLLTQAACRWLRSSGCIFYSLQDCAVTPCTRLHSFEAHALGTFVLDPGHYDLGIRKLIPSRSSALG